MSANIMPANCVPCDACNGTGNACGHHVPDDATMPLLCMVCKGRGYVDADSAQDTVAWLPVLLEDIRDLLWRYRQFCPEAVELRIRISDALDMLDDVREVKVR